MRRCASMIRRVFCSSSPLGTGRPARAKDELVVGMTQMPGTWNPIISSMLAKSLVSNMTARPITAYDANSRLVCLVCTELPTIANGKARVIDLPDGKKGMEIDVEMRDLRWGDGTPVTAKDLAFTLEVGKHPLSGVASSEGYRRILKLDTRDDRHVTMTIDRVTFDYNAIGLTSCRRISRSRSLTPIRPSTATRRHSTPSRPIPVWRSARSARSRSCRAAASCSSRTRPGPARSRISSASLLRSSRTPPPSKPTSCPATSTTCWVSSGCRSTRPWPSRSATRTSTTSSTSRR